MRQPHTRLLAFLVILWVCLSGIHLWVVVGGLKTQEATVTHLAAVHAEDADLARLITRIAACEHTTVVLDGDKLWLFTPNGLSISLEQEDGRLIQVTIYATKEGSPSMLIWEASEWRGREDNGAQAIQALETFNCE